MHKSANSDLVINFKLKPSRSNSNGSATESRLCDRQLSASADRKHSARRLLMNALDGRRRLTYLGIHSAYSRSSARPGLQVNNSRFNYFLIIYFSNNLLWIIFRLNSISTISIRSDTPRRGVVRTSGRAADRHVGNEIQILENQILEN